MTVVDDNLPNARQAGRISALALLLEQSVEPWLARHDWIERGYLSPVSMAYAFAYPWLPLPRLALCLQFELWVFGADKRIDTDATSGAEVRSLVRSWVAVAAGAEPAPVDRVGVTLAELRGRLASTTLWPALGGRWEALFRHTFEGMAREWNDAARLMSTGVAPSFEEYLENSDSCAFRLIRLTDWITEGDEQTTADIDALSEAAWAAEIASRLRNDLRSHDRERDRVDLNAVKIGVAQRRITDRIDIATATSAEIIAPLLKRSAAAVGLARILDFGNAFYEIADFRPPEPMQVRR